MASLSELIEAIKATPNTSNIYFNNKTNLRVFHNNQLIWSKALPVGFSTSLTCSYYHYESQMSYNSSDSGAVDAINDNYFDHTFKGSCGGFQHPGFYEYSIKKIIPIGQTNMNMIATADGSAQHTGYKGGYEYLKVEIYDINGHLITTLYNYVGSIIYVTQPTNINVNIDLSPYNDGTHFIVISAKIGNTAGGEWANYNGRMALTFR